MPPCADAHMTENKPSGPGFFTFRTLGLGVGVGLLNGLLGIGGGILIVPGLIFLRKATPREAVSTSLAAVFFISAAALVVHVAVSGLHFGLLEGFTLLLAGGCAAQMGGLLLKRIPQHWILLIFSAFALASSVYLVAQGLGVEPILGDAREGPPPLWGFLLIGILSGFFSGILGIGGGGITTLGLSTFFHIPILSVIPLALCINVINALSGIAAQWKSGNIFWKDAFSLVPSSAVGIAAGLVLVLAIPPGWLKILFAVFFMVMGTRLFLKGWKERT